MDNCIFCQIVAGIIPSFTIYEDETVYAFADINPLQEGHTLVIPKAHYENIWEIPAKQLEAIASASQKVAAALQMALNPDGLCVMQLNGRGVNQIVMHYHMHLIPKNAESPEFTLTSWDLVPGDMAQIKAVSEKVVLCLKA